MYQEFGSIAVFVTNPAVIWNHHSLRFLNEYLRKINDVLDRGVSLDFEFGEQMCTYNFFLMIEN